MNTNKVKFISVLGEKKATALFNAIATVDEDIPEIAFQHTSDLEGASFELGSDIYSGMLCPSHLSDMTEEISTKLSEANVDDEFKVFFLPEGYDLNKASIPEVKDTILEMLKGLNLGMDIQKKEVL